jgi:predicted HTH domain antitoxin
MKTVTLNIPDSVDINNDEVAMLVASHLYEAGRLSLGQAAEVTGLTKRTFVELLGRYNVSVFNYPVSDLSGDVANAGL